MRELACHAMQGGIMTVEEEAKGPVMSCAHFYQTEALQASCYFDQKQVAELNIALQFQQVVNLTSQQVIYMNILSFINIDFYFLFLV